LYALIVQGPILDELPLAEVGRAPDRARQEPPMAAIMPSGGDVDDWGRQRANVRAWERCFRATKAVSAWVNPRSNAVRLGLIVPVATGRRDRANRPHAGNIGPQTMVFVSRARSASSPPDEENFRTTTSAHFIEFEMRTLAARPAAKRSQRHHCALLRFRP